MGLKNNQNQNEISSPCIRNCCLDEDGVCMGCFRTLTEIMQWTQVGDATRLEYLRNTVKRQGIR